MDNQERYSRMTPPDNSDEGLDGEGGSQDEAVEPVSLTFDQLPEAADWKDGETYQMTVRQVSHDEGSATFEVVDAGTLDEEENAEGDTTSASEGE